MRAMIWLVAALPCCGLGWAQGAPAAPMETHAGMVLTVEQAVEQADANSPEIRAAMRKLALAQSKVATAGSLDDPMLSVRDWDTPLSKPWDLNQAQLMVMVQRTYPGQEKRAVRGRVAIENAQVAQDELDTTRLEVSAEVRRVCAALKRNVDAFKVHDRQAALLKEALAGIMAEYTTGKASQADVLKAQIAVTRLSEHMIELDQDREASRAELNTLLGRGPDVAIEVTGEYVEAPDVPSLEQLESVTLDHRPELAALRQQVTNSREEGTLTRLAMKPDYTVGLGYMLMPSGSAARNAYMAEFSMNLPSLNRARHDGEAKQADAAVEVKRAELEARSAAVFLEVRQAQIELEAAEKRVKLYRDTLRPQAEAAWKAATAAYQNNRGEFGNLIESQNLLLDVETSQYTAAAAVDAGVARLERAIGTRLDAGRQEEMSK